MGKRRYLAAAYTAEKENLLPSGTPQKVRFNQLHFYKCEIDRIGSSQTPQKFDASITSVMHLLALARGNGEHQSIQNGDPVFRMKQQRICISATTALHALYGSKNRHEMEKMDDEIISETCKTLCWMSARVASEFFIKNSRYEALAKLLKQLDKLIVRTGSKVMDAATLDDIIRSSLEQLEAARAGTATK